MNDVSQTKVSSRASLLQLTVFMIFGFTVLLTLVGVMETSAFAIYEGDDTFFMLGISGLQFMLVDSFSLAFPVAAYCYLIILLMRRSISIEGVGKFMLALAIGLCMIWAALTFYGYFTGGMSRLKRFAIFGSYIPPLGLFCGFLLWQLRSIFGFKTI